MRRAVLVLLVGALAGCSGPAPKPAVPKVDVPAPSATKLVLSVHGSSDAVEKAPDWTPLRNEWRDSFSKAAAAAGLEFAFVQGAAAPQPATEVIVKVNEFKYVGGSVGAYLGGAQVSADVTYIDLANGKTLAQRKFAPKSSLGQTTAEQLNAINAEIVGELGPH